MGDVVALVEQVQAQVDQEKAAALAQKLHKGQGFDLSDLREQLQQLQKMGGLASLMDKLPAQLANQAGAAAGGFDEKQIVALATLVDEYFHDTPKVQELMTFWGIGNALHDATGLWFDAAPFTPDRVLARLERAARGA